MQIVCKNKQICLERLMPFDILTIGKNCAINYRRGKLLRAEQHTNQNNTYSQYIKQILDISDLVDANAIESKR